jgi:signal transduction histidine kinase
MRVSLRTAFVAMLLAATVPVAVLMSYLLLEKMRGEQQRMRADLEREAEVLAQAVENELQASIEALRILGLSESLRLGDVREFERSVSGRGPLRSGWKGSFLTDTRGLVLFDTTGAGRRGQLPPVPGFRQMLWEEKPLVSGLITHRPSGQAATVIAVPVVIDGNLRFGLGVWVPWAAWQVLVKRSAPSEGYSVLFDREHRVIARSIDPQGVGEPLPAAAMPGLATYDATSTVPMAHWGVRRDIASGPVVAGQLRSVGLAWATAAACLLLGVTMALLLARRIRRPLEALARGDAGIAPLGAVHVREIAALRDALVAARERDQAAHDGLRRKADEFEILFNSSPIGLAFAQDRDCENVLRNSAMVQLFGRMGGDVEPTVLHQGRVIPPHEMPLCRAARTGQAVAVMELELRAPQRPVVHAIANAVPLRDARGRPRGAIAAMVDITARKEIEAQLVETHEELKAAGQAKDEFLAMLGHELRNPLNAISTAVDVLHQSEMPNPMATTARGIIRRQTLHLSHMIGDLLDMTRILSGKTTLVCEPIDLARLVRRALDTLSLTGDTTRHTLESDLAEAWVRADATRLEQVVAHLVGNAIKYTPQGRRIGVTVRALGDDVVLSVVDEGDGIAPELLPRVFDLFMQGPRPLDRRAGGLGLGLTLVKRLVELHGGTVSAASSPAGSRFEVRLPQVEPVRMAPTGGADDARPALKVLVIEDNADALQSMCHLLRLDGHEVSGESDGNAGLAALLAQWPDVAIVDIGLPGMNGFELALAARSRGYAGRMIAVSGYGQDEDVKRAMKSGFDVHAVKPIELQLLRQWVRDSAHAHT